jgi:hypothetical protein
MYIVNPQQSRGFRKLNPPAIYLLSVSLRLCERYFDILFLRVFSEHALCERYFYLLSLHMRGISFGGPPMHCQLTAP